MAKKDNFWNNNYFGFAVKNILIAFAVLLGLLFITLFFINIYTNHENSEKVPDLKGLSIEEADKMLERHHMKAEIIDSVYMKEEKLGSVVEQNPAPNSVVKPGRSIYLIINSKSVRQIPVPDVRDVSLRQAEAMLQSLGINISSVQFAPSEYKDLVLDVNYNGHTLLPGSKIPEGSSIVLVVGSGTANENGIPSIIGMNLSNATDLINASSFVVGGVVYDVEPNGDEDQYVVYQQRPAAGDSAPSGSPIDVFLSKDRTKLNQNTETVNKPTEKGTKKEEKVKDIENFF